MCDDYITISRHELRFFARNCSEFADWAKHCFAEMMDGWICLLAAIFSSSFIPRRGGCEKITTCFIDCLYGREIDFSVDFLVFVSFCFRVAKTIYF